MKKSIFKRGLASATGILLAASQVGMIAMNTSAANVTIDAAYLTNVPVYVDPDGVLQYEEGDWYDLLAAAYTAADAIDEEIALDAAKDAAKGLFNNFLGEEATAVLLESISNAKLTGNAGKYVLTATLDDCGDVVGAAMLNKLVGTNEETVPMTMEGVLTVNIDLTQENSVLAITSFLATDTGVTYTAENIENYVLEKLAEGLEIAGHADKMPGYADKIADIREQINSASASVQADNADDAYAQLIAALPAAVASKAPATLADALGSSKASKAFDKAVATVNGAQDLVNVEMNIADIAAIAARAYDITIHVGDVKGVAQFSIDDDQNDELLAVFNEYYTTNDLLAELAAYFPEDAGYDLENGIYTIESIESHKELTVLGSMAGAGYEIIRVIDLVTLKEVEETTTTTTPADTTTTPADTTPTPADTTTTPADTTTTPTETTLVYSYEYSVSGDVESDLYYWSEEDVAFDLSAISGKLNVLVNGEVVETIDIASDAYVASPAAPSELAFDGYGQYTIDVTLSQDAIDAIVADLEAKEYDTASLELDATAVVDTFTVIVVERGDANLDDKTDDTLDAIRILTLYNRISVQKMTAEETQASFDMSDADFKAMCYAADVDADQDIDTVDALIALKYYNFNYVMKTPTTWDEVAGVEVTVHAAVQHVDPLVVFPVAE